MSELAPSILLPYMPSIPDLSMRLFEGEADYPAIVAVHQQSAQADAVDPLSSYEDVPTLESVRAEYAGAGRFDLRQNALVAQVAGAVIGYTDVRWWTENDGARVYLHQELVVPRWRNRGIEQAMLLWTEEQLRRLAAGHAGSGKAVFGANAASTEPERRLRLLNAGYQHVFAMLEMEFTAFGQLPTAAVPPGIVVSQAHRHEYRLLWDAMQEAYRGRSMVQALSEDEYQSFADDPRRNPELELAAWDYGNVAGMVFLRIDRGHGVVDECNVHPMYRRRGLARALMVQGLRLLQDCGVTMVRLHCRQHNETGAQQLYEHLGFRVLKEFGRYRKPLAL